MMKRTLLVVTIISFFIVGLGVCGSAIAAETIRIGVNQQTPQLAQFAFY